MHSVAVGLTDAGLIWRQLSDKPMLSHVLPLPSPGFRVSNCIEGKENG